MIMAPVVMMENVYVTMDITEPTAPVNWDSYVLGLAQLQAVS